MDQMKLDFLPEVGSSQELPEFTPPARESTNPKFILLISGKRKSGKDYVAERIRKRVEEMNISVAVLWMANLVKQQLAAMNGLDYEKMLGPGPYKEQYRQGLADLSVVVRLKSIGYYPSQCTREDGVSTKTVWICPDVRHHQDINWFRKYYPGIVKLVRIEASTEVRKRRGFVYVEEIDQGPTECELDDQDFWDLVIQNNGHGDTNCDIDSYLETIINWIRAAIAPNPAVT